MSQRGSLGFVVGVTSVAALGGLLFGYDTAVISGAIGFLQEHYELTSTMKGWTASSALVGCIVGVAAATFLSISGPLRSQADTDYRCDLFSHFRDWNCNPTQSD